MTHVAADSITVKPGEPLEDAFKRAQTYGCAEVLLTLPVPPLNADSAEKPTTLDRLRLRGTPLELIYSYLLAGDAAVDGVFCTCLLETLHEQLTAAFADAATVRFKTVQDYRRMDATLHHEIPLSETVEIFAPLALEPTPCVITVKRGAAIGFAPLYAVDATSSREIADDAQAAIYGAIHELTAQAEQVVMHHSVDLADHGPGHFIINIVASLSSAGIALRDDGKTLRTHAEFALSGYYIQEKD